MKKLLAAALCAVLILLPAGCAAGGESAPARPEAEIPAQSVPSHTEPPADGGAVRPKKVLLKLQYLPRLDIAQAEPTVESADLPYSELTETDGVRYDNQPELQIFAEDIAARFQIAVDGNWSVFVHFYDPAQTVGMVQFQYYVGNVATNKSMIFQLDHGRADTICYSCPNAATDETALRNRVAAFQAKYEQEPYALQDGETFESETVNYSYNYETGDLVYSYTVFFSYDAGAINNDYGTICRIDEGGNAV